jgi:hypothetical protein
MDEWAGVRRREDGNSVGLLNWGGEGLRGLKKEVV